jgi:hypothetical protein
MATIKVLDLTEFVDRTLKQSGKRRKDNNLQYFCPFCNHHKRKLEIRMENPYQWHCWVCNAKGVGIYSLLKKIKAPRSEFVALEKILGISEPKFVPNENFSDQIIIELESSGAPEIKTSEVSFPGEFKKLFDDDGSFGYKHAIAYAKKRKITVQDIIKYNIGYCNSGPFANRLVFPSYNADNSLNFYSCRSYYDSEMLKYKNSETSKDIIGFENLIDFSYPIYLCEGALDAISLRRNAIPLFGKTMSSKLKAAIISNNCPEINIVLDDDALKSAIDIAEQLLSFGKRVRLVRLEGKDPNVLGFAKTMEQIEKTDFLDFHSMIKLKLN